MFASVVNICIAFVRNLKVCVVWHIFEEFVCSASVCKIDGAGNEELIDISIPFTQIFNFQRNYTL